MRTRTPLPSSDMRRPRASIRTGRSRSGSQEGASAPLPLDFLEKIAYSSRIPGERSHRMETNGMTEETDRADVLRGTLDMLVLQILAVDDLHGWGICERIEELSADQLVVNQGSLYPALRRMTNQGWIVSDWRTTESNRRARYYGLTPAGRARLDEEVRSWRRSAKAVDRVLREAGRS